MICNNSRKLTIIEQAALSNANIHILQISAFYCLASEKADCSIFSRLVGWLVGRSVSKSQNREQRAFGDKALFLTFPHEKTTFHCVNDFYIDC